MLSKIFNSILIISFILITPVAASAACFGQLTGFTVEGSQVTINTSPRANSLNQCKVSTIDSDKYGSSILGIIRTMAIVANGKPWVATQYCDSEVEISSPFALAKTWCGKVNVVAPN